MRWGEQHAGGATAPADRTSRNISFADVSLMRVAIASHRLKIQSDLGAKPAEIAWFCQSLTEVRPGLCLSYSATLGSPECILSARLRWFTRKYQAACLIRLEEQSRPAESVSTSDQHSIQARGLRASIASSLSTDPTLSGSFLSAVGSSEQRGAQVPEAPLHVPTPQLHLLRRYGLMCGENQRVPIYEAVRHLLRGMLLRYYKQLPLAAWQRICLQFMHEVQKSGGKSSLAHPSCDVSLHETSESSDAHWPEECPWERLQEVSGDMVKLMLFTVHEVYSQSLKDQCLQNESNRYSEAPMLHEGVVQRLHALSSSSAVAANMLLTDAPVAQLLLSFPSNLVGNDANVSIRPARVCL